MLVSTLRKDTDGEILVFAASALALVCENAKHRIAALTSGVLEVLLLHVSQPFLRMQLIVEFITHTCLHTRTHMHIHIHAHVYTLTYAPGNKEKRRRTATDAHRHTLSQAKP